MLRELGICDSSSSPAKTSGGGIRSEPRDLYEFLMLMTTFQNCKLIPAKIFFLHEVERQGGIPVVGSERP